MRCAVPELLTHPIPVDGQAVKELWQWRDPMPTHRPLTLCAVDPHVVAKRVPNFRDFTGKALGRNRVAGLIHYAERGKSVWSVVCDCGAYETRGHLLLASIIGNDVWGEVDDACASCLSGAARQERDASLPRAIRRQFRNLGHDHSFT